MGEEISRGFLAVPLTLVDEKGADAVRKEHHYHSAHFLEYLFASAGPAVRLPLLWKRIVSKGEEEASEQVLAAYARDAGLSIDEVWPGFVAYLILDKASPVLLWPASAPMKGANELEPGGPGWSGPLPLVGPYTGAYERFTLRGATARTAAQVLKLTVQGLSLIHI